MKPAFILILNQRISYLFIFGRGGSGILIHDHNFIFGYAWLTLCLSIYKDWQISLFVDNLVIPVMLDAPVSGGVLAAEAGTLTFMVWFHFCPSKWLLALPLWVLSFLLLQIRYKVACQASLCYVCLKPLLKMSIDHPSELNHPLTIYQKDTSKGSPSIIFNW